MDKRTRKFNQARYEKGLVYARYTLVRYFTAALFVMNLYWLYMVYLATPKLLFIPIVKFVLYIVCFADQHLSMENKKYEKMKLTKKIMPITGAIDLILIGLAVISFNNVFPYFANMYIPIVFFLIQIVLIITIIYRIRKVEKNRN